MTRRTISEQQYTEAVRLLLKRGIAVSVKRMLAAHVIAGRGIATFRSLGLAAGLSQRNTNRVYGQFAGRVRRALRLPAPEIEILTIASAPAPPIDAAEEFSFRIRPAFARALKNTGALRGVSTLTPRPVRSHARSDHQDELFDGPLKRSEATRWERNREARRRCIEHFGAKCQVCRFDFGKTYGSLGTGFVEVHHASPSQNRSRKRSVDPLVDLVPVCSNCHRMLHRREPPIGVRELQRARGRSV